jgi:hypothetical protein
MKTHKFILLILPIILLGSCAKKSSIRITTNTFANKEVIPHGFEPGASFSVETTQKGNPLFTKEVSQKIATLLKSNGFETKTGRNINYNLKFSFGMKQSTHTRDVPVFIPDYGHWYYDSFYGYGYSHGYNYTVAYVPEEYTLFNKILLIEVYKKGDKETPIWQGTAHSYQETSDLRNSIDYLLVTVLKHFGKNTQRYIKSKMKNNDPEVEKLRQEYFRPIGII